MRHESGSLGKHGVLTPKVPLNIGAVSQRRRILDALAHSCASKGFAATTIADIVGPAHISRATFYKQFANKRECFDAGVDFFIAEMTGAAVEALAGAESRTDALRQGGAAVLDLLAANSDYAKLVLVEAPIIDLSVVGPLRELTVDALARQWEAGQKDEWSPAADARIAFGRAQVLIAYYLTAGRTDQLPGLLPELVYVALLPFVGQDEALKQASLTR